MYGTDITFPVNKPYWQTLSSEVYRSVVTDEPIEIYRVKGKGLKLSSAACSRILCNNFIKYSGVPQPSKINVVELKKYIEKYIKMVEDDKTKQFILDWVKTH